MTLHPNSIRVEIERAGLNSLISHKDPDGAVHRDGLIELTVPAVLKRRGVEAKQVVGGAEGEVPAPDDSLIALLVRAHRWLDQLAEGEIRSAREIARRDGIDASEVSRTIRLAFLAPGIVAAIFAGHQTAGLTPRRLMRIGDLPLEWRRQRRLLGSPPDQATLTAPSSAQRIDR